MRDRFVRIVPMVTMLCLLPLLAACSTIASSAALAAAQPASPGAAPTGDALPAVTLGNETEITVLAASSLTEAFNQIAEDFHAKNPSISVHLSFAGSQDCVAQIQSGAKADIFASASKPYMDTLVNGGFVEAADVKNFAGNKLVVVARKGLTPKPSFTDLADQKMLLVIADETVPVGKYTLNMLDKITDAGNLDGFSDRFLSQVVSRETNVKLVLQKVEMGEADAGVVYTTDAKSADPDQIITIDVPDEYNVPALYPAAVLKESANAEAAQLFMDYIFSPEGQATLQSFGFTQS